MDKKDRFLIWHYKHHYLVSFVWTALGWIFLPAVAIGGENWFWVLFLLWYVVFCIFPAGCASALMVVCTKQHGLVETET